MKSFINALNELRLHPTERLLLIILSAQMTEDQDYAEISFDKLIELTGIEENQGRAYIKDFMTVLEHKFILDVERQRGKTNRYRICLPPPRLTVVE